MDIAAADNSDRSTGALDVTRDSAEGAEAARRMNLPQGKRQISGGIQCRSVMASLTALRVRWLPLLLPAANAAGRVHWHAAAAVASTSVGELDPFRPKKQNRKTALQ